MAANMTLDEMVARHDDDPHAVAEALRALEPSDVADTDATRCSFLAAHVIGELLGRWNEAFDVATRLAGSSRAPGALRHRAAAATLSGRALDAWAIERTIGEATGASPQLAAVAVRLAVLQYVVGSAPHDRLLPAFAATLDALDALASMQPLGAALGAALNNTVSTLLDRAKHRVDDAALGGAMRRGAEAARRAWREAGTWTEHERADYLVALVGNATGDWDGALAAAEAGLATIAANGSEDVDRAFLLLEAARAHRGAGRDAERDTARAAAFALAASFDEPSLKTWFDERAAA